MKKILLILVCTVLFSIGALNVSAETYRELNYKIENGEVVITDCSASATSITIPTTIDGYPVTVVGDRAFSFCESLNSVIISDSVKNIGEQAFAWCKSLEIITIPNSVEYIDSSAFAYCKSLKSVILPTGIECIKSYLFSECSNLQSVHIPESVNRIETYAFSYCDNLTDVYYANSGEKWDMVKIGFGNDALLKCNMIFKDKLITVTYNGEKIEFDQEPIIDNGRTLVPLRAIFEKLGAEVEWNGETQTVIAKKADTTIELTINNTEAKKNGVAVALDVPAKIINGRTLVPVRFVSDCFGVGVEWDAEKQQVVLTAK